MKKYKFIKSLPFVNVGTILYVWKKSGSTLFDVEGESEKTISNVRKLLDIYDCNYGELIKDGWLEEIKEKSIYNLEKGDKYRYINDYTIDSTHIKSEAYIYKNRLEYGNVFLTKEEAEKELKKRKALAKIKKWIYENNIKAPGMGDYVYYIGVVNNGSNKLIVYSCLHKLCPNGVYFKYHEDAYKCLKECKKEWEILFDKQ